ncbi:MAG TPA: sigma-70 family RNA polymerase sigma factor [Ignavibacteria bacterium]|nr:sigma-70 family RNA polymerase sigma factor [Ignavibacteria bacterium]
MRFVSVAIPTNESFLIQWNTWIYSKVAKRFKRDKGRISDTVQNVRLRLLQKDFIGRWFFKHLTDDIVDRIQAERILGGARIEFIGKIPCLDIINNSCNNSQCIKRRKHGHGCSRSCPDSLWKISDLLEYAKFDFNRYYYSPQNHTISSDRILNLIGYPQGKYEQSEYEKVKYDPKSYSILESLYRQGRLKPSELTDHECTNDKSCSGCIHGRNLLKSRSISLMERWSDSPVEVSKLRWMDSQLTPFLRHWRGKNMVYESPLYIMREPNTSGHVLGIDAGLLKYVSIIINNEVVNDFNRMSRSNDIDCTILNNGMSPEFSNLDLMAYDGDDGDDKSKKIFSDLSSMNGFSCLENKYDIRSLINNSGLTEEERSVILSIELMEMTVRQYSKKVGISIPRVNKNRVSAIHKIRNNIADI